MRLVVSLVAAFATCWLPRRAEAHTGLAVPASREGQGDGKTVVGDPNNEFACGKADNQKTTDVKAGTEIPVQYWRNNHIGGFARWSIIKQGEPETIENFDKNVFYYTCQESGDTCKPNGLAYSRYEKANDNSGEFSVKCGDKIRIPEHLEDATYVLQYTNFGTGHSYGNPGATTPMYRACALLKVTGGTSKPKPACPTFVGGDRATKGENQGTDKCLYFISTEFPSKMVDSKDPEFTKTNYKFGAPAAWEKCIKERGPNATTPSH